MISIAIDLGTTNIKAAAYTENLKRIAFEQRRVDYDRFEERVEFSAERYFETVFDMVCQVAAAASLSGGREKMHIVLTGQAESLILLGENMSPLCKGISWMDMRAVKECDRIRERFGEQAGFRITGEAAVSPTWPAAKLLWFKRNEPALFSKIRYVLLLKDYIQYRLTGIIAGELSIRGFTYFFDINKKQYWKEMLDFCGIEEGMLPALVSVGSVLGEVLPELLNKIPGCGGAVVNTGILDHFAGMMGMGVVSAGAAGESAGTVLSLTAFTKQPDYSLPTSYHCGMEQDGYLLFSCCDNGGICYDWFKRGFLPNQSFSEVEALCGKRPIQPDLLFFPYLTGTNAPDFEVTDRGMFCGFGLNHDRIDFARAVMESAGYLLRRNLEEIEKHGIEITKLYSSGGGTTSRFWCQMKSDICGLPIEVPAEDALVCRGAAMIGLTAGGVYPSVRDAALQNPLASTRFLPGDREAYDMKYQKFRELLSVFKRVT